MLRLRLLGPFPPPFGGVALHLVRLMEALRRKSVYVEGVTLGGIPAGFPGVRRFRFREFLDRSAIHYHTDEGNYRWMILFALWWRLLGIPYALTVHSFRHRAEFSSSIVRRCLRRAYTNANAIIAISDQVKQELHSRIGVNESHITVVNSALPVSLWEKKAKLPDSIPYEWLTAPVRVLANAGRLVRYQGKDLYGLDVIANAFRQIDSPDLHCLIVIGDVVDVSLFDELRVLVRNTNNVQLMNGFQEILAPVVGHAHIVLRPTRTEGGQSLTLSEAIELGRWAVGSDAVTRPKGTILFRNEDSSDLARAVRECEANVKQNRFPAPYKPNDAAADAIIVAVFEALTSNRR